MVKNEEDVIESFVRHTLQFADFHLICDHMSTDRTREILNLLKSEGLPIEIFSFDRLEFALREVITNLLHIAIENYDAGIIIPLDADEFVIKVDGNSQDLRQLLQNLPTDQIWNSQILDYRLTNPDQDQDKFLLSRPIKHGDNTCLHPFYKIIIGREFALKHDVQILQGNHGVELSDGRILTDQDISNDLTDFIRHSHFHARSANQMISKYATSCLNSFVFGTRYTPHARYLSTKRNMYLNKIDSSDYLPDDTYITATELEPYKNECVNKFSGEGGIDPLRNIFLLAESYANIIVKERILAQKEIVRIFLLFDGDVERSIQSLESVFDQTYEFKKIFVTLLTTKNLEQLYLAIQEFGDRKFEIEFVYRDDFQNKLKQSEGIFVQFVVPGDKLLPNKIMNSVEFMHSDLATPAFFCGLKIPQNISMEMIPTQVEYPFKKQKPIELLDFDDLIEEFSGQKFLEVFLSNDIIFASGLSRGFFHQKAFDNIDWINEWLSLMDLDSFCLESSSMFFILNVGLCWNFKFLNEILVIRGVRNWNGADLQHYNHIHDLIARICSEGNFA